MGAPALMSSKNCIRSGREGKTRYKKCQSSSVNSGIDPKQSKLNLGVKKSVDAERKKRYDAAVTEFNVCDGRPFELSAGAGFQKLCKRLTDSGYVPSHPTNISRKVQEVASSIEHKTRSELRDVVANNNMLSATFGHWKADNQKNFMVITVHFLYTIYELKSYSLGVYNLVSRNLGHKAMENNEIPNSFLGSPKQKDDHVLLLGTILDPRFKSSLFLEENFICQSYF